MGIEARPNLSLWEVDRMGQAQRFPHSLAVIIGQEAVGGLV